MIKYLEYGLVFYGDYWFFDLTGLQPGNSYWLVPSLETDYWRYLQ